MVKIVQIEGLGHDRFKVRLIGRYAKPEVATITVRSPLTAVRKMLYDENHD